MLDPRRHAQGDCKLDVEQLLHGIAPFSYRRETQPQHRRQEVMVRNKNGQTSIEETQTHPRVPNAKHKAQHRRAAGSWHTEGFNTPIAGEWRGRAVRVREVVGDQETSCFTVKQNLTKLTTELKGSKLEVSVSSAVESESRVQLFSPLALWPRREPRCIRVGQGSLRGLQPFWIQNKKKIKKNEMQIQIPVQYLFFRRVVFCV